VEEDPDVEAWQLLTKPFRVKPPAKVFAPNGCLECRDTGYMGRMGIYEILPMTSKVQSLVRSDVDLDEVRKMGFTEGMRTLRLSGAQKVGAGLTTIAEVLRVSPVSQDN
jgi:general secretion pathway protein E